MRERCLGLEVQVAELQDGIDAWEQQTVIARQEAARERARNAEEVCAPERAMKCCAAA